MAGPSDIAAILSQSGRIEKINQQSPFANADISKQIITEQEARERMRFAREVNESKRVQEASERQRKEQRQARQGDHARKGADLESEKNGDEKEVKHLIDVVI